MDVYRTGFSIAVVVHSVDRSLSIRLIQLILLLSQKPLTGLIARDGKQNPSVGYSDTAEIRAHSFD